MVVTVVLVNEVVVNEVVVVCLGRLVVVEVVVDVVTIDDAHAAKTNTRRTQNGGCLVTRTHVCR